MDQLEGGTGQSQDFRPMTLTTTHQSHGPKWRQKQSWSWRPGGATPTHTYKMFVHYTLPTVVIFQLAYKHAFFSNTVCLLFLHLTCVNVVVGVQHHLRHTEVARAIH